jgi:outer membrane protein with beta-barrel domain
MKTLLFIALASSALIGYSQNNNTIDPPEPVEQSKFSIGVKGGFGHTFMIPYKNYIFCPSWDAGISAIYAPGQHWGLGVDALYSMEGVKFEYLNPVTGIGYDRQATLNYVRIPVKAIYFFRDYDKDFRPKITLGPSLGILAGEVNSVNASSIDLGGKFTAGFNYRIARAIWINVDASYYQGFMDVYSSNTENDLNGNVRLDAGINFGF